MIIASPPYKVGKEYDKDLTLGEYLNFLYNILKNLNPCLLEIRIYYF